MPAKDSYIPRLSVDIREDQLKDLQDMLPYGVRRQLIEVILDSVIEMLKVNPGIVMGGLITKRLKFTVEIDDGNTG